MSRADDPFAKFGLNDGLTPELHYQLSRWLRSAAEVLGLQGWSVVLSAYQCSPEAHAEAWVADESDMAWIALERDFLKAGEVLCRASLTHELLHLHFQRVIRTYERLVENELGTRTEAVIELATRIVNEQTVDRLGTAVSEFLPHLDPAIFPDAG